MSDLLLRAGFALLFTLGLMATPIAAMAQDSAAAGEEIAEEDDLDALFSDEAEDDFLADLDAEDVAETDNSSVENDEPTAGQQMAGEAEEDRLIEDAETGDEARTISASEQEEAEPQTAATEDIDDMRRSLDEIVVTAQRREQDIKDVPVSVTSLDGQTMEEMDMSGLNDLNRAVPTLKVGQGGIFNSIAIRGLGSGINWGVDQAVGIFVDDVYYTGAEKLSTSMMDIRSIEILRGPQGTLFGRNTIAGALLINTGIPEHEWGGNAEVTFGDLERIEGNITLNAPIIEDYVAARGAFRWLESQGEIYDRLMKERHKTEGRSFRGKLRYSASDNLDMQIELFDQKGTSDGGTNVQYWNIQEEHLALMKAFDPESEGNLWDYRHSTNRYDGGTEWQRDLTARARLTAWQTDFLVIANYSDQKGVGGLDFDYGPIPAVFAEGFREIDQGSVELRAVSNYGGDFEFVAGLYYFTGTREHLSDIMLLPVVGTGPLGDLIIPSALEAIADGIIPNVEALNSERFVTLFYQETDSYSAYGQITAKFWEDFTMILGARYAIDQKSVDFKAEGSGPGGIPTPAILMNYSLGASDFHLIEEREDKAFDPKVSVLYALTDEVNVYGTIATGSKNGGFNAQAWSDDSRLQFDDERSLLYEIGVKGDYFDNRLRLNVAAFHTEFWDLQATVWNGSQFVVDNAANVITKGFEIESQSVLPWDFFLLLNYAYLDATYKSFPNGPCIAGSEENACDISGEELPYTNNHQISGSLNWTNRLGNLPFDLILGLDGYWQSDVQMSADQDPLDSETAFSVFNGRIGLMGDDQHWNFMIYVRNLFETQKKMVSYDAPLLTGTHVAIVVPPRAVSAHFSVNW